MVEDHEPDAPVDPRILRELVEGTAAETGAAFFDELVRHLAQALDTKGAWVTEWHPGERTLRALAFWYDGAPFGDYAYAIRGTPCEPVIEREEMVHVPDRLVELFPDDPDLSGQGAVSYLGVPLFDVDGAVLGHLAALDDAPMPRRAQTEAVFRVFAGREDDSRATPFQFTNGEPPVLLGDNEGANPVEFLLHALAGCVTTTFVLHATARGVKIEELSTEIEGDLDVQGLLDLDEKAAVGYEQIRIKMHVQADCSDEELDALLAFTQEHSPVCNTVCRPVPVRMERAGG